MRKKVILLSLLILISAVLAACLLNTKDYKRINKIASDRVRFYYIHEEMRDDGYSSQYLMAYTYDSEVVPLLKLKKASYLKEVHKVDNNIYLFNDMKIFYHDEKEDVLERSILKFNCNNGEINLNKKIGNDEGNYYFSEKTCDIKEVSKLAGNKIKSFLEYDKEIIVQYGYNTISRLGEGQNEIQNIDLEEYFMIYKIKRFSDKIVVVGIDHEHNVLIELLDLSLKTVDKALFEQYENIEIFIGDQRLYGIGFIKNQPNQLLLIDNELKYEVLDAKFPSETLYYSEKEKEVIYYDSNKGSYVFLDGEGNLLVTENVTITDKRYNFPNGRLYID
ncbi:MAG: hypothetical protein GX237_07805 [Clostridiales bacterium]|nr:hypothetical protein [Clostridiales bacterium]